MGCGGLVTDKPVPSLAQWLGDGKRAEGFEEWIAETLAIQAEQLSPDEASIVRIVQTLTVAFMEAMRAETERHGRSPTEVIHFAGRAAGVAIMSPILSLIRNDATALLELVRVVSKDFKVGAKQMTEAAIRGGHHRD